MNRLKFWSLALAVTGCFFGSGMAGASYDLDRVLQELSNRENSINTIQFNFKQEISFTEIGNKTVVTGEALFGKKGRLRISKQTPDKQLTISDGKKLWVFNPAAKQVWEGAYKKWVTSSILPKGIVPLNNYVKDLRENFDLKLDSRGSSDLVRIAAHPKREDLGYSVVITVDPKIWLPVETTYHSATADVVTMLSEHHVNPTVQESAFRFIAPSGVDVIPFN